MADPVAEVNAALESSLDQHVEHPGPLSHEDRARLALHHDVHSVWGHVRNLWRFKRGVPEEEFHGYAHESDAPEPLGYDTSVAPLPTPAQPVPVEDAKAAAESAEQKAKA